MRGGTKRAAWVAAAVALAAAAPASAANWRNGIGFAGGHVGCECGPELAGVFARAGFEVGPFTLDLQITPSVFQLDEGRGALLNPTSLVAGLELFDRFEVGVGPAVGGLHLGGDERGVVGIHTRVALHSARKRGWVLSLETMPVVGHEVALTTVFVGLGWGRN